MRKPVFLLALLTSTASTAHAQSFLHGIYDRLSFGVKGGGSATGFTGPGASADNLTWRAGFTAGATVGLQLTEHFSVQEDFLYAQKGASLTSFLLSGNTLKANLSYLDVPFMLRYTFGAGGTGFFVEAGPTGSFLLTQRSQVENSTGTEVASPGVANDDFTRLVAGYAGGIGYTFGNGLQVNFRYTGDFRPVYQDDRGYPELHNTAAQLQVAYLFGRRRK